MRQVYVNGDYKREDEAKVSIFDRGLLFSDPLDKEKLFHIPRAGAVGTYGNEYHMYQW